MDQGKTSPSNGAGFVGHFHEERERARIQHVSLDFGGPVMTDTGKHPNSAFDTGEQAKRWEQNALGALLEEPTLWPQASTTLTTDDFLLKDHRTIFRAIAKLQTQGLPADLGSVLAEVGTSVDAAYLVALIEGAVVPSFPAYALQVRKAARERQFARLRQQLNQSTPDDDRTTLLQQMQEVLALKGPAAEQDWRAIFHSIEEFENAPPLRFAINNFLQEAGISMIGGLAGHGKTLVMLSMGQALLDGTPLFGHELFTVPQPSERVLYLIPECSIGPFWSRLQLFRMQEHVRSGRLLVRTLSSREQVSLDDARLLKAAEGADVFLDTAVRFMDGNENDVADTRPFVDTLFRLLASGARTITGAHHAPKGFENQEYMTLQNLLRGSGDIGAMLCACWGLRQIDADKNQLFVQNTKPRDFQTCAQFVLEGRPHLDETGHFKMLEAPGLAGELRSYLRKEDENGKAARGRPVDPDKDAKLRQAVELRAKGLSIRDIAKTADVKKSTLEGWLFEYDSAQPLPTEGVR